MHAFAPSKSPRVFRLKTGRATSRTGPLCGCAVCLCNNLSCRSQRSNAVSCLGPKMRRSRGEKLADPSVLPRRAPLLQNHVQRPRFDAGGALVPQEPTKPARVVAKLAALVVLASPPPVRARRHGQPKNASRAPYSVPFFALRHSKAAALRGRRQRLPEPTPSPHPVNMKQSTAMLLGMLTSKMKQIEDMSTSARAIASRRRPLGQEF